MHCQKKLLKNIKKLYNWGCYTVLEIYIRLFASVYTSYIIEVQDILYVNLSVIIANKSESYCMWLYWLEVPDSPDNCWPIQLLSTANTYYVRRIKSLYFTVYSTAMSWFNDELPFFALKIAKW